MRYGRGIRGATVAVALATWTGIARAQGAAPAGPIAVELAMQLPQGPGNLTVLPDERVVARAMDAQTYAGQRFRQAFGR